MDMNFGPAERSRENRGPCAADSEHQGMIPFLEIYRMIQAIYRPGFSYGSEKEVGDILERGLIDMRIAFEREYQLAARDRIDFFLPDSGIGLELKIGASQMPVLRQLIRYAESPEIKGLIVVTIRPIKLAAQILDKPTINLALWRYL